MSVFSGVDLSNKKRLEPAVFTETRAAPVTKQNAKVGNNRLFICCTTREKKTKQQKKGRATSATYSDAA